MKVKFACETNYVMLHLAVYKQKTVYKEWHSRQLITEQKHGTAEDIFLQTLAQWPNLIIPPSQKLRLSV